MIYLMEIPENWDGTEALLTRLPAWKQEKLGKIRNERARNESLYAWALLFYGISREYGISKWPDVKFGVHGKPEFASAGGEWVPFFSLSHTQGAVLCAVSDQAAGADIQRIFPYKERAVRYYTSAQEWEILQGFERKEKPSAFLWSLKEAYLKCTGTGLSVEPQSLDFSGFFAGQETFYDKRFQTGEFGGCVYAACGQTWAEEPVAVSAEELLA
ncbi:MAG: 4'-phosphopantetheinyl transferase superfamily protein [Eubacteriales bacterium]|nr:4'-phosphopantetheinyl transferase superfamily protein [Eubacteriales bacterium]